MWSEWGGSRTEAAGVRIILDKTVVGELSLLDHGPRTATVVCESDCTLYVIDQRTYRAEVSRLKHWSPNDAESLKAKGVIKSVNAPIKVLGSGDISKKLTVKVKRGKKTVQKRSFRICL